MEAIRMYTINTAYASFEEKIKGSIEPEKMADMIIVSENPLSIDPIKLKDIEVEATIIDGNRGYYGTSGVEYGQKNKHRFGNAYEQRIRSH